MALPQITPGVGQYGENSVNAPKVNYQWVDNGSGGVNYYADGSPITNAQFGAGTGQDYGSIEKWVADQYKTNNSQTGADTTPGAATNPYSSYDNSTAYDANTDPNAVSSQRSEAQNRIAQLNDLYGSIYGDINNSVADKRSQLDKNYGTQFDTLNNDYQKTSGALPAQYAAMGLSNSSYLGNAMYDASKVYNTSLDSLNQNRDTNYATLGQTAASQKAQMQSGQDWIHKLNLADFTDVDSLTSLRNTLDQQISSLTQQKAGLLTNSQYKSTLDSVAPAQQTGSAQLQAILQKLATSNAPAYTKNTMAAGAIKGYGNNDPQWQEYWNSLNTAQ